MKTHSWPPGFVVHPRPESLPEDLLQQFRSVPSAHAADCMGRLSGAIGLKAWHGDPALTLCGMAITVRVRPGDNLLIHQAMLMAQPGDVIVVDGAGDLSQALVGGLMRTTALTRGLAGFVINGVIRDLNEWAEGGTAIYALGHTPRGPSKTGPGEVNVPICCAGMSVQPGDLILGDADGVVSIPRQRLSSLLDEAHQHAAREERIREVNAVQGGDEERINELLRAQGCPL